jgi:hypothetical protein
MKKIAVAVNHRRIFSYHLKNLMVFLVLVALSVNNVALNSLQNIAAGESFDAAQNTIARMFSAVNLPFKMVEGHFKNTGAAQKSGDEKTKTQSNSASQFSLVPVNNSTLKAPAKQAPNHAAGSLTQAYSSNAFNFNFAGNALHKRLSMEFMLCIIMLLCLSVLPRGVSPDNINKKNINSLPLTAVFLTKHGFFSFLSGSKWGI